MSSCLLEVVELHRALADASDLRQREARLDSWHMFEQSGRLLVPNCRTKSWYRNAASFEVRPDV